MANEAHLSRLMIFHDDDVMAPDMLFEMNRKLDQHPRVGAIGANTRLFGQKKGILSPRKRDLMIGSSSELLKLYCYGVAPCAFPSYVYKTAYTSHCFKSIGLILQENTLMSQLCWKE